MIEHSIDVFVQSDQLAIAAENSEVIITMEATGLPGEDGVGVPDGGTTGQHLAKASDTDQDTEWVDDLAIAYAIAL